MECNGLSKFRSLYKSMSVPGFMIWKTTFLALFVSLAGTSLLAQPREPAKLRLNKVEPPNWWLGMKTNRVQLMLYGEFPTECKVESDSPLKILEHSAGDVDPLRRASSHLFVDIEVPSDVDPGNYGFKVTSHEQTIEFEYPIHKRESRTGRHQGFGPSDTIYLITPDRFANGNPANDRAKDLIEDTDPSDVKKRHGGDLQGIIDRLPYLQDLGITAIWLNPILESNGVNSYHGYKATDLYRVDSRYGTNQKYKELVTAAHEHGIKVIFDHVSNHIGLRHPWIKDAPTKDWFNGSVEDHLSDKHYLLSLTDPHASPVAAKQLKTFWFVDRMPDLNQRDPKLATYLTQNMIWWIEYTGLDGIREDTYPYADQTFLANWSKSIRDEYPDFNIVGEIWATKPAYIARFQDKTVLPRDFETHLPAVMDFPLMNAMRDFVSGEGKLRDVYEIYSQDFLYTDLDNLLVFLDNHDTSRAIFHAEGKTKRVQIALGILLTSRGIPQILYGTELGMLGGKSHVELRADFPGGFPGHDRDATTASGRTDSEEAMFQFTKKLLHLRKTHPALTRGKLVHCAPTWNDDTYKFVRVTKEETIVVVANGHDEAKSVSLKELSQYLGNGKTTNLLSEKEEVELEDLQLDVEALGVRILKVQNAK